MRTLKTNVKVSKINNTFINLGELNPVIFTNIMKHNFELYGYYRKEANKNNVIFTIQSDIVFKGRQARNQRLFYELISPFLISPPKEDVMKRKIYNPQNPQRVHKIGDYTQEQKKCLPTIKKYLDSCSYKYADYGELFFNFEQFECFPPLVDFFVCLWQKQRKKQKFSSFRITKW